MLEEQIKQLTVELYGYDRLEVVATMQYFDNAPYKAGMWIAFVSRTAEDCPNELTRDLDSGWGLNKEQALKNLRDRLLRQLNENIQWYTKELVNLEAKKIKLEQLQELEKRIKETL